MRPALTPRNTGRPRAAGQKLLESLRRPLAERPGLGAVPYDTAWLAAVPERPGSSRPRFPGCLQWLLDHQRPDGSWGGQLRYEHDRLICTLAALPALAAFSRTNAHRAAVEAGRRYIWQHGHRLAGEPVELVGFELLLPALVERVRDAGIMLPPLLDLYATRRAEKLRLIPPHMLYSASSTVAHSLEFLGSTCDTTRLRQTQSANGSVGNSPAATAFFLSKTNDPSAQRYLQQALAHNGAGASSVAYPCETFELLWTAYHLHLSGMPARTALPAGELDELERGIAGGGVGLSASYPLADADDTAVALLLLHDAGRSVDSTVLQQFAVEGGHFASYPLERHPSTTTNVHALHALLRVPGYPNRRAVVERLLDFLLEQRTDGLYWLDKWHISPYYATAHTLLALAELPRDLAGRVRPALGEARRWLRQTQNADGSWGAFDGGTAEETAYGVLALGGGSPNESDVAHIRAAGRYLSLRSGEAGAAELFPALWVEKCLYAPRLVVEAAIEAALTVTRRVQGDADHSQDRPAARSGDTRAA